MRSRNAAVAAGALCVLIAVPASAGAAAPAATTWAGWDAPGPIGVGKPVQLAANGPTTALLGDDVDGGAVSIAVTGPSGSRVGRVAVNGTQPSALSIALQRPGRLLLSDGCRVRSSDDNGLSWTGERLPGCTTADVPQVTVANDDVSFASIPTRTWRTTDGGATWSVVNDAQPGPAVALGAEVGLRIVSAGDSGYALQRTVDGGASWGGIKLPGASDPVDTLPALAGLALAPGDGVLLGAGDRLLVSGDGGQTFTAKSVPIPDDLPGATSVAVESIVCDPTGSCVVGVRVPKDGRRSALRFDGGTFGARVAALPARQPQAPTAGNVVGLTGGDAPLAVRTTDLGVTPYRAFASGSQPGSLGVHGLLALSQTGRLHVSSDGGGSWTDVPLPDAPNLVRVASLGGQLIALADNGKALRYDGGWKPYADVSSVKPKALAVAGGTPVVVGERGIVRLTASGGVDPASGSVIAGRGFADVTARQGTVLAWMASRRSTLAVRSADGGRTWKRSKLPAGVDDVQLVTSRIAYAQVGGALYRSTDGGRSFKRRVAAPFLGAGGQQDSGGSRPSLAFSSATRGTMVTPRGAFYTGDGGKHLAVLPTPGNQAPVTASLFGNGVLVQDLRLGSVFRAPGLLGQKRPSLTLKVHGKVRSRRGKRTLTVLGRIAGQPADSLVSVLATDRRGATIGTKKVATTFADGSFRMTVTLSGKERGLQAWYRGAVRPTGTSLGATSKVLTVK